MYQASLSYPSEIVPFLELGLLLLATALLFWRPRPFDAWLRRGWRRLAALGPRRSVLASAALALLGSAATMLWLGFPVPRISDELGYLLVGDTLAHGRLTNPTPRVPAAFEAVHVVVRPSYTSKYPPAQGALLAAGQLLGHPGIGVCLSAALLAAACCWFLQGWLPPPWPLVGATLVALRLGIGGYWGQSYWGGAAAAIGGLLMYGALPRLDPHPPLRPRLHWGALALGVFLLANSRPFEGAVAALPAAVVTAIALWRHRRRWRRSIVALALALAAAGGATAAYNRAVTGNPLQLPYQLHVATYGVDAVSPYVAPPPPAAAYSSPVLRAHLTKRYPRPTWWGEAVARGAGHFSRMSYFVCGLPLMVFAVLSLRRMGGDDRTRRWKLFALLCCLLPAALHSVTAWWSPHYSAAAVGPLLLLAMLGMREVAAACWRGRRFGPWPAFGALLVMLPLAVIELPAYRPDADDSSRFVRSLERRFAARQERGLVVVDDGLRTVTEWVYNPADLDSAPLLWIQDLGPEVTRQVVAAYGPRRVYRVTSVGHKAWPRLEPVAVDGGGNRGSDR